MKTPFSVFIFIENEYSGNFINILKMQKAPLD